MVDIPFHGLPRIVNHLSVAELLPYHPWHNDSGVRPTETVHVHIFGRSVLRERRDAGVSALGRLRVAYVLQPLMEETACVGEECSGLGKHLRVSHPSQTLVALRAVCGH